MPSKQKKTIYTSRLYDSKGRFMSYWHQIHEAFELIPKNLLEIGVGNKFVSNYLKERGINTVTLDIERRVNPDIIGSVLDIPFSNERFDLVMCCQVLEHLPYKNFRKALSEIFRVSSSHVILSLPDINRACRFYFMIFRIGKFKKLIPLPKKKAPPCRLDSQHFWEIGREGYSLKKIVNDIKGVGFKIKKTYRIYEYPYHRFFILEK